MPHGLNCVACLLSASAAHCALHHDSLRPPSQPSFSLLYSLQPPLPRAEYRLNLCPNQSRFSLLFRPRYRLAHWRLRTRLLHLLPCRRPPLRLRPRCHRSLRQRCQQRARPAQPRVHPHPASPRRASLLHYPLQAPQRLLLEHPSPHRSATHRGWALFSRPHRWSLPSQRWRPHPPTHLPAHPAPVAGQPRSLVQQAMPCRRPLHPIKRASPCKASRSMCSPMARPR